MLNQPHRKLIVPGNQEATLAYGVKHLITLYEEAVARSGFFTVALSGGSTPKAIYERWTQDPSIDWSRVILFWSDERAVPPDHPDSNYHMAMEAGFKHVPIPSFQIHRMHAEENIEENALKYEQTIRHVLQGRPFDLVMLGMGEDGHRASLFPETAGLKEKKRLVIANYVPQKKAWRMTLTFPCINNASHIAIYVLGASKKPMLEKVFENRGIYPIEQIGSPAHPALWITDQRL